MIYTTNSQCYRFNNLKNVSYYLVNALILVQNNILTHCNKHNRMLLMTCKSKFPKSFHPRFPHKQEDYSIVCNSPKCEIKGDNWKYFNHPNMHIVVGFHDLSTLSSTFSSRKMRAK